MTAIVEHADEQKERAGRDSVRQHLVDGTLHGNGIERKDAEYDEAEVAHRRVGDKLFQVWLHQRYKRAIDDADDGQRGDVRRSLARCQREERQAKAHHAVSAHLEEHASKDDGACSGRFDVRVRQPRVQWKERHLNGERQKECQEQDHFRLRRKNQRSGL